MATIMRQTLTTKAKIMVILFAIGIAIILFGLALALSGWKASAHTRHHEYPKPCDSGLVGPQEATISYEGGEDIKICPTDVPVVTDGPTPSATPSATPTVEPTVPPAGHGDGLSDGKSDGKSSCPTCTQAPATSPFDGSVVGWK